MKPIKQLLEESIFLPIDKYHNCEAWTGLEDTDENYFKAWLYGKDVLRAALPILKKIAEAARDKEDTFVFLDFLSQELEGGKEK